MKRNIWTKIVILLILVFFILPSLSPAEEVNYTYETDLINNILPQSQNYPFISGKTVVGEKLDTDDYSSGYVEHMDDCIARSQISQSNIDNKGNNEKQGVWVIPSRGAIYYPHSGNYYVINKWGDTMMGISFPTVVDVHGAWFAGQGGGEAVWTSSIRVLGYNKGEHTQTTDWFKDIDEYPSWCKINLIDVDRIVIEATPVYEGAGWYAMDDFSFTPKITNNDAKLENIILNFEDCFYKQKLSDNNYAGLTWETGTGDFNFNDDERDTAEESYYNENGFSFSDKYKSNSQNKFPVDAPTLLNDYQGVIRGDATSWSYPPDSCGAAGPNHFVEVVNRNFAIYNKSTGEELTNILLGDFLPGSNGDPRVLFDQYSNRWFVIVCDFNTKLFLAVSTSDDPTDEWFKCDFVVSQGSDAGKWPDYQTLGVDEVGVYTAAYMIGGGNGMSIFALDKAPLIDEDPYLGDIFAFRELPWEGAIQPVHTYGTTSGEYFVSRASSTSLRVRFLSGLTDEPVLTELGYVTIPSHSEPPDAPALGSNTPLDTVGHRLMNAVYRDGYIWTAHCIGLDGRAASRWYKIDVSDISLDDYGTIEDSVMYYFFPSIMVNANGDAIMGFSGSHAGQYAAAYYTGRLSSDPPGEMATPVLYKEGEATYNLVDGYGRNRWGDYSLCSLDPVTHTLWTIQEYAHIHDEDENRWGTWICELRFSNPPEKPTTPEGPDEWTQNVETNFSTSAIEPDGEQVYYKFDWGDGDFSDWVGPYNSGETGDASHTWEELGDFEIRAIAKDVNGVQSEWSEPAILSIVENEKPTKVVINGPNWGFGGEEYEFTFTSTDPESSDIYFRVDWDDGDDTGYIGPYSSGETITLDHKWKTKDTYWIKAWAKDTMGGESNQASHKIYILTNSAKSYQINLFFSQLLERLLLNFPTF
jgi:hypothetical protein